MFIIFKFNYIKNNNVVAINRLYYEKFIKEVRMYKITIFFGQKFTYQ